MTKKRSYSRKPRPIEEDYARNLVSMLEYEFGRRLEPADKILYIRLIQQGPYAVPAYHELREVFLDNFGGYDDDEDDELSFDE